MMFIKNFTDKDIGPISCEGYWYTIPPGVSAVWDVFGKDALNRYKPESIDPDPAKRGARTPIVAEVPKSRWKGNYAIVERFKVNPNHFEGLRNRLIDVAEQRGVDKDLINKFRSTSSIENDEIVEAINKLPVPEEIRFPVRPSEIDEDVESEEEIGVVAAPEPNAA